MNLQFDILWSGILTAVLGFGAWMFRNYIEEQKRLQILINRTREEMAKEYITKTEVKNEIGRILKSIDALDKKMDRLIEKFIK